MNMKIDQVLMSEFNYDNFIDEYLVPEKPLLIRQAITFDTEVLTPTYIRENFADENKRQAGWFDADLVENGIIQIPEFVKQILKRDDMA